MKQGKKMLNAKLERHMAGSRALPHGVYAYIYIYIYMYIYILNLRFFILVIVKQGISFNNPQNFHVSLSLLGALFG